MSSRRLAPSTPPTWCRYGASREAEPGDPVQRLGSRSRSYGRYETLAVHATQASETIVVEQQVFGSNPVTGAFVLPNLVVVRVSDGLIRHFRDYVDVVAAAEAMGRTISWSAGGDR
jgi:ketosteroid isomerase-like protein